MVGFIAGLVIPLLFIALVAGTYTGTGRKLRPDEMPLGYIRPRRR